MDLEESVLRSESYNSCLSSSSPSGSVRLLFRCGLRRGLVVHRITRTNRIKREVMAPPIPISTIWLLYIGQRA